MKKTPLSELITAHFLDWQKKSGEKKTLEEYAQYLGLPRERLNNYLNKGTKAEGQNVELLASKIGPEVYDALGLQRPNPKVQQLLKMFDSMTFEGKEKLIKSAERILKEQQARESDKRSEKSPA